MRSGASAAASRRSWVSYNFSVEHELVGKKTIVSDEELPSERHFAENQIDDACDSRSAPPELDHECEG
jgi:hypothetical protein